MSKFAMQFPRISRALILLITLISMPRAYADCRFSSTAYPLVTPFIVDSAGLALNGASFIEHGNVMAAGRIDNLILFHVDNEIIPQVSNIVYTRIDFSDQIALYAFADDRSIQIDLAGVTTVPHSQLNVKATYVNGPGPVQVFYLICN